jgi:hypothetical protein
LNHPTSAHGASKTTETTELDGASHQRGAQETRATTIVADESATIETVTGSVIGDIGLAHVLGTENARGIRTGTGIEIDMESEGGVEMRDGIAIETGTEIERVREEAGGMTDGIPETTEVEGKEAIGTETIGNAIVKMTVRGRIRIEIPEVEALYENLRRLLKLGDHPHAREHLITKTL